MKVRHRQDGFIYSVVEESATYYICKDTAQAFRKDEVEPVQEDHWQDVTGECIVASNGDVRHGDLVFLAEFRGRYNYRLRKVQLLRYQDDPVLTDCVTFMNGCLVPVHAFLVERRVS